MPIRLRLSLIVALIAAVLVVIGCVILDVTLGAGIKGSMEDSLRQSAARVQKDISKSSILLSHPGHMPTVVKDQNIVQVVNSSDQVEYATETSGVHPLLKKSQLPLSGVGFRFITTHSMPQRLLLVEPAANGAGFLIVGSSLDELSGALSGLYEEFFIGGPLVVLIAAIGGWFLARRALDPVEKLRAQAELVAFGPDEKRLDVPNTMDEIERLGVTFNALIDRLRGSLKSQKEFISAASHELRSPLVALRAELEVARLPGRPTEELRKSLELFEMSFAQLNRLVDDLLLLARGDELGLPIELVDQPLAPLVAESLRLLVTRANRLGVSLILDGDIGVRCAVDRFRFRQIVENLVGNALSYASGSPFVEVNLRKERGTVVLEVKDMGPGFSSDFLPKAFDRFSRGSASRRKEPLDGAGLGLPIVKLLVEAHGGTVEAGNRVKGGASVEVRFPTIRDNQVPRVPGPSVSMLDESFRNDRPAEMSVEKGRHDDHAQNNTSYG